MNQNILVEEMLLTSISLDLSAQKTTLKTSKNRQ